MERSLMVLADKSNKTGIVSVDQLLESEVLQSQLVRRGRQPNPISERAYGFLSVWSIFPSGRRRQLARWLARCPASEPIRPLGAFSLLRMRALPQEDQKPSLQPGGGEHGGVSPAANRRRTEPTLPVSRQLDPIHRTFSFLSPQQTQKIMQKKPVRMVAYLRYIIQLIHSLLLNRHLHIVSYVSLVSPFPPSSTFSCPAFSPARSEKHSVSPPRKITGRSGHVPPSSSPSWFASTQIVETGELDTA